MPRSSHGGRHELGQNFLHHRPTIHTIVDLVRSTSGPILEIGAGGGALTRFLAELGRPVRALEIDEHRIGHLRRELPGVRVEHRDVLAYPLDSDVIVGNVPFHLTTPILRRLLRARSWSVAVLLVQWEVARKRAGVGGGTLLTAQAAPWFRFELRGRVAASSFTPRPSVDGGILVITRRPRPLIPDVESAAYEDFAARTFTGAGRTLAAVLAAASGRDIARAAEVLRELAIPSGARPRDLSPEQWAALWIVLGERAPRREGGRRGDRRRRPGHDRR